MASGVSSSGSDLFPPALRVLAVDDDLDSLIALEKMLLQCSYQVTKCQRAEDALSLLRENNSLFDILLTEIQMPEMSGFQLLAETLKLPINLPVIFFSADLDQDKAKEGINAGASYVLSKPISMDILKVIWQIAYCFPKRGGSVALVVPNKGLEEERGDNLSRGRQGVAHHNNSNITAPAIGEKKPRFMWTDERHNLFVEAVEFLGADRGVPRNILEYMQRRQKDSCLTRHVICSHLQKHRGKRPAKQGASYDKDNSSEARDNSSEAPYSRDAIQPTSSEIPPMGYTETPSPCSIQTPTTSNITPAVSSSQSSYLDQGTMSRECCQTNEHEPIHNLNLNVPPPSHELQQNAVGSGYSTRTVSQPSQHLNSQDLVNQDL